VREPKNRQAAMATRSDRASPRPAKHPGSSSEARLRSAGGRLLRFLRTPKGLLLLLLLPLVALGAWTAGLVRVLPGLAIAAAAAMLLDALALRWRNHAWEFPSGALLTAMIVAMILSPYESWFVPAAAAAIGVLAKQVFRVRTANIFNPAALGLVAAYYLFHTGQDWWGSLPELAPAWIAVLIGGGLYISNRLNKMTSVLAFLGGFYLLATGAAFLGHEAEVAELFRSPDINAALYFAFFMVTDPPTSPPKVRAQIVFGVITAVASFAFFEWVGAAYYLLAGLLVANAWEGARRARAYAHRQAARGQR
jgi:Na+-translocating ferredoxin:NAD+ oxidoreductase RnfD subunit